MHHFVQQLPRSRAIAVNLYMFPFESEAYTGLASQLFGRNQNRIVRNYGFARYAQSLPLSRKILATPAILV
jgi:hypothetical protein